jgi:mono/diheme cytochrome c family protein
MRRFLPLVAIVCAAPVAAQRQPMSVFQQQKARALFADHLPCLGCHELDGTGGRSAPSLTGVGARRGAAYVGAMVVDPQAVVPGVAMPRILMPRGTRDVIIAYLTRDVGGSERGAAIGASAAGVAPLRAVVATEPTDVNLLYGKWCSSCHGARGGGDGPNAKYLPVRPAIHASAVQMSRQSDEALFDAIAGGGIIMGKSARMPAFGATLSAPQIHALVAYIRTLCACSAPAWSRDGSPP